MSYDDWKLETPPDDGPRFTHTPDIAKEAKQFYLQKGFDLAYEIAEKYSKGTLGAKYWADIAKELLKIKEQGL